MSKTLTTKEAMQALLEGKKLKHVCEKTSFIFLGKTGNVFLNKDGKEQDLMLYNSYEIYEEPKPKKQVWQWRTRYKPEYGYTVENQLLTEQEAAEQYSCEYHYEKHAGPFEVDAEESIRATSAFTQASARVEE